MIKFTVTSRIIFVALTLWLVFTLVILSGCKDKDQSEDTQQAAETQKTEHISASEKIKQAGTSEKLDLRILYVVHSSLSPTLFTDQSANRQFCAPPCRLTERRCISCSLTQVRQIKIFFAIFKKNIIDANQSEVILGTISS